MNGSSELVTFPRIRQHTHLRGKSDRNCRFGLSIGLYTREVHIDQVLTVLYDRVLQASAEVLRVPYVGRQSTLMQEPYGCHEQRHGVIQLSIGFDGFRSGDKQAKYARGRSG